jgi:pimeloyl-ACP methyl ester carboxylesterase
MRWAAGNPTRVKSITLINCGLLEGYKWHGFARIWQTPILGELSQLTTTRWGMKRALNGMSPKPMPDAFFDRVMKYADWGHKRAVLRLYRASKNVGRQAMELPEFMKTLPVCVIWGAGDPFIQAEYAEKQKRYFPSAEIHVLQGLGHWPFIDDVETVRIILLEFLSRQTQS